MDEDDNDDDEDYAAALLSEHMRMVEGDGQVSILFPPITLGWAQE